MVLVVLAMKVSRRKRPPVRLAACRMDHKHHAWKHMTHRTTTACAPKQSSQWASHAFARASASVPAKKSIP
eukprot:1942890-Amphidinium_carterae.2